MSTERDALLEALLVERYGRNQWWRTDKTPEPDDDLTCARRRREMAADFEAHDRPEKKAT